MFTTQERKQEMRDQKKKEMVNLRAMQMQSHQNLEGEQKQ